MKNVIGVVAFLAAGVLGGCASSHGLAVPTASLLGARVINDPKQVSRLEKAITDKDIARLLDVDVRAKLPTSVAVASLGTQCSGRRPHLAELDAEELAGWEKAFEAQELVTGAMPVSRVLHGNRRPTLHSLRAAAAKMNCELLLVYLQADSSVDNYNDAAVLYWTLVGLWLVPGNVLEQKTVMQAVLVDCRTGMILGTATGDCHLKRVCPMAFGHVRRAELAKEAPGKALADLQEGVGKLIARVVTASLAKK